MLAELGIIGGLLFAAALLVIVAGHVAADPRRRRAPVVVAGLGALSAWLVHTSVDWMHLLPGLTGVALLGAAVLLRPPDGERTEAVARRRRDRDVRACCRRSSSAWRSPSPR